MIASDRFLSALATRGYRAFTGVPCSYLKPFINQAIGSELLQYVPATNEGDAVAIATGAELGGMPSVVMFQNSGLANAVSPLVSLNAIFRVPVLLIVTWRGEPGGKPDEPQHELMGAITREMLELMRVRWELFPTREDAVEPALERAARHMASTGLSYAFVMREGSVAPHALEATPPAADGPRANVSFPSWKAARPMRADVLRALQSACRPEDALIATTGYMGRALYALGDRENQLYVVGSMGCASSVGLGLALAQPARRVFVLDGDGAALMRLGALATIGRLRPRNLVHVLLDNERHESTGGQATVADTTDLALVAHACGYPAVHRAPTLGELERILSTTGEELAFVHVKIRAEESVKLPRPEETPEQVARRFRAWLVHTSAVPA